MVAPAAGRLAAARDVLAGLRTLREPAPPSLAGRVMAQLGPVDSVDSYSRMQTPLWPLLVAWGRDGITAVGRADDPAAFEAEYRSRTGRPVRLVREVPDRLTRAVEKRMRGESVPGLRVDLSGLNEFQRRVLAKTMEIPHGEVRPYAWIAEQIGHPRAQRAVGTALARNPVPFVIPCHRVVRSDGRIGRYGAGGSQSKRAVLQSEGVDPDELERLAQAGIRYIGSDTTRIACFPTCRNARRITAAHRVPFRSARDVTGAGFRACRSCRPFPTAQAA